MGQKRDSNPFNGPKMRELLRQGSFWPSQSQVLFFFFSLSLPPVNKTAMFPLCYRIGTLFPFVGDSINLPEAVCLRGISNTTTFGNQTITSP